MSECDRDKDSSTNSATAVAATTTTTPSSTTSCSSTSCVIAEKTPENQTENRKNLDDVGEPPKKKHRGGRKHRERVARAEAKKTGGTVQSSHGIYISGLPLDTTEEELLTFCGRCGIVRKDGNAKPCVRLYHDSETGTLKGDASVLYLLPDSVDLALLILDGADYRIGHPVKVTRALHTIKPAAQTNCDKQQPSSESAVDSYSAPAAGVTATTAANKKGKVRAYNQKRELQWGDGAADCHVVLRHMFTVEEASQDTARFVEELREDIRSEAERYGDVGNIAIFPYNPEGIVVITYADTIQAERGIEALNGRYFAGRRISAEAYDGYSDFAVTESEEAREHRLDEWHKYLDEQSDDDDDNDDNDS